MPNLENLTRFGAVDLLSLDKYGVRQLVILVAGRFDLPGPGEPSSMVPAPAARQEPPVLEDVHFGDPATSSLRREGQSNYVRPGTDLYLTGHARAPSGYAVKSMLVELRVGSCVERALVTGDRRWDSLLVGAMLTDPQPFEQMPLVYERAFGGSGSNAERPLWEPRNPVGVGLYANAEEAHGQPAPNIEDADDPVTSVSSRPRPCGFTPIARSWLPRRSFAGTFDESWIKTRAPLWPLDFDERFFCAASPNLISSSPLTGGEPVRIRGVSAAGTLAFRLPRHRLVARVLVRHRSLRRRMLLDAVHFDTDEPSFTMTWRASFALGSDLAQHRVSVVRELESWEDEP